MATDNSIKAAKRNFAIGGLQGVIQSLRGHYCKALPDVDFRIQMAIHELDMALLTARRNTPAPSAATIAKNPRRYRKEQP